MNQNRKVIILTNTLGNGGAQRMAVRLANNLSRNHTVFFLPFSCERSYELSERVNMVNWDIPDIQKSGVWRPVAILWSRIKGYFFFSLLRIREKPDATLSFLHKPDKLNLLALGGGRKVVSERNNPMGRGKKYFRESCRIFRKADKVVFQSETIRNLFPVQIAMKGVVVPNFVEVTCKASEAKNRIVTIGRLHPQKNHALLIRAFSRFLAGHPDYTLHIYGHGDMINEMEKLIASLSLGNKVFIEGFELDVHKCIADARMFVLSSDYEGMPNALLEAMMMGLPCVTTSFEGSDEFFSGTDSCLMVPLKDELALADAMSRLADDDEFRSTLSERGEAFAQRYSPEHIIPLWEEALWG